MNIENIITDYENGDNLEIVATRYHIGKIKLKEILLSNGIEIRKRGGQKLKTNHVINDWRIEKYPKLDNHHYIAISNIDGKEFNDYMNDGGYLTSYIKDKLHIQIPTLYDRRKYYMETGNYWWEQWFTIVKKENKPIKKCPYCDWSTKDINNLSGAFEVHLMNKHNISKENYLKEYPEDRDYFTLVAKTLDLQMSTNEDEYVVCAICGKKLARIDWRHLKEHNITKLEYIEKYGNNLICKNLHDKLSKLAIKTNMNMEPTRHSKPELEIKKFVMDNGFDCKCDRKVLKGKELDILIPSKNIAIEFNGNKHHTEWFGGKDKDYHITKTNVCKSQGIGLIHIFEDEFQHHKELVFNNIANILEIKNDLPLIKDNECVITEVDSVEVERFLNEYDIQGYKPSTIHYGAFYEDKLITVMSFVRKENEWELTRFASDFHYLYENIFQTIFNYFLNTHNPNIVKSFADRRWVVNEDNNMYTKLGFKFSGYVEPDFKYYNVHVDKHKRFDEYEFNSSVLIMKYPNKVNESMTKSEMLKELGYDRIWNCGYIKYVYKRNVFFSII